MPAKTSDRPEGNSHTLLIVSKAGYTTFEALHMLATFFAVDKQAIHCQGLKDEDGVTEQLVSVQKIVTPDEINTFNAARTTLEKGRVTLTLRGFSKEAVREKNLHGNVFQLTLRNIDPQDAERLYAFCANADDFVCLNYYDQQRFGLPGGPFFAHKIGEAIIASDWQGADALYKQSGNAQLDFPDLDEAGQDALLIDKVDSRKLAFFVGAYASLIWNQALSDAMKSDHLMEIFDDHQVRIMNKTSEAIPPLIATPNHKLDNDKKVTSGQKSRASFIRTTVFAAQPRPDNCFPGRSSIDLQFFLPAGSYATILCKQLILSVLS